MVEFDRFSYKLDMCTTQPTRNRSWRIAGAWDWLEVNTVVKERKARRDQKRRQDRLARNALKERAFETQL